MNDLDGVLEYGIGGVYESYIIICHVKAIPITHRRGWAEKQCAEELAAKPTGREYSPSVYLGEAHRWA